ncbi:major coat protein [Thiobacillus sp.]|uniref:major coat protein n=1 Tax=Thiobacillus sp. TaxID=924 RepID=UPI001AC62576|nr:major coat protein [Thiobacillus sp.]MBN8781355.1 hypothetical protein [Thiobacillus sp.]
MKSKIVATLKRAQALRLNAAETKAAVVSTLTAAGFMLSAGAHAALDAAIATGLTGLQSDASDLLGLVWPVVIFVMFGIMGIRLFKKVAGKAV